MKIKIETSLKSKKSLLIVPVFEEDLKKTPNFYPKFIRDFIKEITNVKNFKSEVGESYQSFLTVKDFNGEVLFLGLGSKKSITGDDKKSNFSKMVRNLGANIGKTAMKNKTSEVSILLATELEDVFQELVEGIRFKQYTIEEFKTKYSEKPQEIKISKLDLIIQESKDSKKTKERKTRLQELGERANILADGAELIKNLVNSPANKVDAEFLAKTAKEIAKENKYKVEIFGDKQLTKKKFGGILAVNQGANREAKLICLQYFGAKSKKEKPLIFVGKGVIFDTGGYNIKQTGAMETMHQDMAGGATVLGLFHLLKKLKIERNVIGLVPSVENLINENAYRPSDIIKMYDGKTVEITNTDAEGRMILADSLAYATEFDPDLIVSIATLTGASEVALGNRYCAMLANPEAKNSKFPEKFKTGSEKIDEPTWELPIHDDYRQKMKSKIADLRNYDLGSGRGAGTAKAAAFLENFVDKKPWCHFDIGGTAFTNDPKPFQTPGATAHGLRIFVEFLENYS